MGVAGFSVGSIIYSCLQFGGYFDLSGDCQLLIVAVKPALRILFMVAQTVFIFSYTDVRKASPFCDHKYVPIALKA